MKCLILFSGKNCLFGNNLHEVSKPIFLEKKKNIVSLSCAESVQLMVKVKTNE